MEGYEYNNTRNKNLSAVSGDDLGLHNIDAACFSTVLTIGSAIKSSLQFE